MIPRKAANSRVSRRGCCYAGPAFEPAAAERLTAAEALKVSQLSAKAAHSDAQTGLQARGGMSSAGVATACIAPKRAGNGAAVEDAADPGG